MNPETFGNDDPVKFALLKLAPSKLTPDLRMLVKSAPSKLT